MTDVSTTINEEDGQLLEQLEQHEGKRLKPYTCTAGRLTIGIGRNIQDVGITPDEAMYLLKNDIKRCMKALDRNLPWWRQMSANRQRVLIDMCFNMGIDTLLTFKQTLKAMEDEHYGNAADRMMVSLWAKQVGYRAKKLSEMMRIG